MSCSSMLVVENLEVTVGDGPAARRVVRGVSFSVRPCRVMGLVGESGCGKSMTCLSILNLLPQKAAITGGSVTLGDVCVSGLPPARLQSLRGRTAAMILQNPMSCFDPVLTVRHHFRETLRSHPVNGGRSWLDRSETALREAGFEEPRAVLDLYPFQMSGGMLQRAMIALAVLMEAPLLVADEPTTDLDAISQARVLDLILSLRERHETAVLLVTHDLSVIARMADDVAVMREGEIVEAGTTTEIFHAPRHPYTASLLDAHLDLYRNGGLYGAGAMTARTPPSRYAAALSRRIRDDGSP